MASSGKGPRRPRQSGGEPSIEGGRELTLLVLCHLDAVAHEERSEALGLVWDWASNAPTESAASTRPPLPGQSEPEFSAGGQLARLYAQEEFRSRAESLTQAWLDQGPQVDTLIDEISERWRLARMDVTDRNVIRLATLELKEGQRPKPEIVADAVRLASRYGAERSARFVNGLVESVAKHFANSSAT